jgi:hypothetical protein
MVLKSAFGSNLMERGTRFFFLDEFFFLVCMLC